MLNDADAAGLAEEKFGAGKDNTGVIVLLTFGTGIGSAVIHNGVLLPNTEFGHLEVGGKEAEHRAASSIKERKEWSYERWTKEVTKVLVAIENAIWPDLFIAGGGISRKADKWIPLLKNRTPVVAAALQNRRASSVPRWPPRSPRAEARTLIVAELAGPAGQFRTRAGRRVSGRRC